MPARSTGKPFTIIEYPDTRHNPETRNAKRSRTRAEAPTNFVCIDGEGITLPDGTHKYVLLGVGDQQISNPDGLSFDECLEFLWDQRLSQSDPARKTAYIGFFLGYDFTQWISSLPESRARSLLTIRGKAARKYHGEHHLPPYPVQSDRWEFDILGTKRFKFRPRTCYCQVEKGGRHSCAGNPNSWMNICDTGPFFQKSFLKVIDPKEWSDPVVTPQEYATILEGKSKRASATLDRDMLRYNRLENEVLARVMPRLESGFKELGIQLKPNQWFGPGQAAQSWLNGRAITSETLRACTPAPVLDAAQASYFGGWFEIMAHGIIPGNTYEYDINSAYPYIISTLPCLEHGTWVHGRGTVPEASISLIYAQVEGSDPYIGAMPHRDAKSNIYRPHRTEGWYWLREIQAAIDAGLVDSVDISDSWTYLPCEHAPPLREVRDIYALRKKVGKKTPLGIACKLVPNSLYGKFAQSVGKPKFGNPIYASLITSGCRTKILEAIATHPNGAQSCVMVATDGVYFREPHPNLPVSGELGDWDTDQKSNLCLFKPGVYWDDAARRAIRDGESAIFKARGISARDFSSQIERIDNLFSHSVHEWGGEWPKITYPVSFAMHTALQALMMNDWTLAGQLIQNPVAKQSSDPSTKRAGLYDGDDGILRSDPRVNEPYEPSHPYEKRFGMDLDGHEIDDADIPFTEANLQHLGENPDGLIGSILKEGMQL